MAQFAVEIDDFSGGLDVGFKQTEPAMNTWTGRDVLVTPGGLLVPRRRALIDQTSTGTGFQVLAGSEIAENSSTAIMSSGSQHVIYQHYNSTPTYTVYHFTVAATTITYVQAFTVSGRMSKRVIWNVDPSTGNEHARWIEYPASTTLRRINLAAGTTATTVLPSAGHPNTLALWGQRLVYASSASPGRIYYSNAGDYGTWPSANYVDVTVTNAEDIIEIIPSATTLWIGRRSGWLALTGTPTDMNALQVRPLDAGAGTPADLSANSHNINGRILYNGSKPGVVLRERLAVNARDLAHTIEGDETEDFVRRGPLSYTTGAGLFRLQGDGIAYGDTGFPSLDSSADWNVATQEVVTWLEGSGFQRHVLDPAVDEIGGAVLFSSSWPSPDDYAAVRGMAYSSNNRMTPWMLPLSETRPVHWSGGATPGAVTGVWRSQPIAGPTPARPFKVTKVIVELHTFRTSGGDTSSSLGNCSVACQLYSAFGADLHAANTASPTSSAQTITQAVANVPDDWQRQTWQFNVNDMAPTYKVVVQLSIRMVAIRRVIVIGEHTDVR